MRRSFLRLLSQKLVRTCSGLVRLLFLRYFLTRESPPPPFIKPRNRLQIIASVYRESYSRNKPVFGKNLSGKNARTFFLNCRSLSPHRNAAIVRWHPKLPYTTLSHYRCITSIYHKRVVLLIRIQTWISIYEIWNASDYIYKDKE